jgi:hypothetical protein
LLVLLSLVLLLRPARAAEFDAYGGYVALKSQQPRNGYFTVEKIGNRWWFITPAGHAFVALSVSGVGRSPSDGADRDGKGYKDYVPLKYGKGGGAWVRRWEQATLERLRSWGFNTIGTFSYGVQDRQRLPFYQTLRRRGGEKGLWNYYPQQVKSTFTPAAWRISPCCSRLGQR